MEHLAYENSSRSATGTLGGGYVFHLGRAVGGWVKCAVLAGAAAGDRGLGGAHGAFAERRLPLGVSLDRQRRGPEHRVWDPHRAAAVAGRRAL